MNQAPAARISHTSTSCLAGGRFHWGVAAAAAGVILLLIGVESVAAFAVVMMEGMAALLVLVAAGSAGGWLVRWIGMGNEPLATRWIIGTGLGIGHLSLAVLVLGALGLFTRTAAFVLVGCVAVAGLIRLALDLREIGLFTIGGKTKAAQNHVSLEKAPAVMEYAAPTPLDSLPARYAWLWLLVCPFVALMLVSACLPPGILWPEEAGGYDVLEYHLAVPKFWAEHGRITFLPTNVYSNFPMNSEMWSLLMMQLRGDTIEACFMAVAVNVGFALLLSAAAWLAGRQFSPGAGLVAGILAATTPWIAYLAGIAYVEVGMLAMGMGALALILRWGRTPGEGVPDVRPVAKPVGHIRATTQTTASTHTWFEQKALSAPWCAGMLAGLACGFKYTALPLIAMPIGLLFLFAQKKPAIIVASIMMYACGVLVALSPWMIRNTLNTGNPFFPLAYSVFGDRSGTWDPELNAQWTRAHGSATSEASLARRAWDCTLGDDRLSRAVLILAAVGAIRRRDRWTLALLAMLAAQVAIWLTATHLFARFAVVMLLPLLVLAGRAIGIECAARGDLKSASSWIPRLANGFLLVVVILGSATNLSSIGRLYFDLTRSGGKSIAPYGQTAWFLQGQLPGTEHFGVINGLPESARVMLVGESRTFYLRRPSEYAVVFNHHPLADAEQRMEEPAAVLRWLQDRGITHLLVHWPEIERLSRTYGFDRVLANPEMYRGLAAVGLRATAVDKLPPYITLYEVPQP